MFSSSGVPLGVRRLPVATTFATDITNQHAVHHFIPIVEGENRTMFGHPKRSPIDEPIVQSNEVTSHYPNVSMKKIAGTATNKIEMDIVISFKK